MNNMKTALSIAGTDPTGGAGTTVDLKVFQSRGVYGMSVVTSIVAQNTLGVQQVFNQNVDVIAAQLDSVYSDIIPDAVKTGMLATSEVMDVVRPYIVKHDIPYVIDPVMVAKSGDALLDENGRSAVRTKLLDVATVVTPNIPELEEIVQMKVETLDDIKRAGKIFINEIGSDSVLIKGGHLKGDATDYLFTRDDFVVLKGERYDTKHTHGTGCTYSAVITSELAKGKSIVEAVQLAKRYMDTAIRFTPELGHGQGPVNHFKFQEME
ncbi:bifunctional hydroxymethylpyrimidine kinase/phosphomethylpyrimidine kinase [Macrococcoides bohemicum]|uniref:Hydroxymethylpyrimidine/phosphomethylpyrimidine kinase n=1 Tax=Macrococcoides bohemicum TaxID=1903056 RepID=A0AAJ4TW61_9STAP|nr:bifunctional hydroxymethylpyrimidine kinase/phosphomethylpyrimidine kinase [Macrococcus bohemicus]QYA42131.1 bifunctional hydroxymethylpyrimidine kinase/phosphomethylpyrimidine kinase [Macrococcus bohemicus]QYA44509.1 bifunctional hydroxymethylpyrimidine kinase/phosphomethylpyrimidine kinase [Macrococcus bohemicus]